MTKVAVQLISQ